jgi:transposase
MRAAGSWRWKMRGAAGGRGRSTRSMSWSRPWLMTEKPPARLGITHWSARFLAAELGISFASVARIWRKWKIQPHRIETFKFSTDPELEAKVRDVIGLYLAPLDNAVVVSVDEKSQIQALDRTAPMLPLRPGLAARRTHDYKRHGTTTLFAALEVATGKIAADACYPRHRHQEFLRFLKKVAAAHPGTDLPVALDNYGMHKHPEVRSWLAKPENKRIVLHFTPTGCSWLNMVPLTGPQPGDTPGFPDIPPPGAGGVTGTPRSPGTHASSPASRATCNDSSEPPEQDTTPDIATTGLISPRRPVNRDLLRHHHPPGHPPRHLSLRQGPHRRDRPVHRRLQRPLPAIQLDQRRRRITRPDQAGKDAKSREPSTARPPTAHLTEAPWPALPGAGHTASEHRARGRCRPAQ